jgi:Putative Flp pilus-assembly TadE/G-like
MAGKAARPPTPRGLLPPARARRAHRGGQQRGQIIPLVALLMIVLTGFAALAIDAGVGYSHSRNDQDVADAAALAGSYWIFEQTAPTTTKLTGAYTAATNVAGLDCTNSSCPLTLTFYNASGYVAADQVCQATSASSSCLNDDIESGTYTVSYVGASVSATQVDYFANVDPSGSHSYTVNNQAVAQVSSSGSSSGAQSYSPTAACEICVLDYVSFTQNGNGTLEAGAGSVDIGGYVSDSSNGTSTVQTYSGYGIDIIGSPADSGDTLYYNANGNGVVEASGYLGIDGKVYDNSNGNVNLKTDTGTTSDINISGSVTKAGNGTITVTPSHYGTSATASFTDPLATTSLPSSSGLHNYGAWTSSCPGSDSETLQPGIYSSITVNCNSNDTLNFTAGTYIINGSGILDDANGNVTYAGSGVTFYFTCSTSGGCGATGGVSPWSSASGGSCSATASGANLDFAENGNVTLDLTSPSGGLLFFFDPCNSNASAVYDNANGTFTNQGAGTLYSHSGCINLTANGNAALPGPIDVHCITNDANGNGTIGTTSGSLSLGTPAPAVPGGLIQ